MQEENRLQEQEPPSSSSSAGKDAASTAQPQAAELIQQLSQAEAKLAEMQDAYLRAKAETENLRRRMRDEVARASKFGIENFAEALLPVKDHLETALKIETPSVDSLKEGVEMTLKQLDNAFIKNGLAEISPAPGDKLDPMQHEAVSMIPANQEANTIVSILQKGYMLADRLLRPALVVVASGSGGAGQS